MTLLEMIRHHMPSNPFPEKPLPAFMWLADGLGDIRSEEHPVGLLVSVLDRLHRAEIWEVRSTHIGLFDLRIRLLRPRRPEDIR